ncbi:MAG: two-component system sensor histidine kinase NtrB [Planctomycetota bacterium]
MQLGATQLRALLDASDRGLALLDEQGIVQYANAALAGLGRAQPEEAVGSAFPDLFPELGSEIDWALAAHNAIRHGREVRLARLPVPDGGHVDCHLRRVELDPDGTLAALVSLDDVSERVRTEERTLRRERTDAIANFGESVAHEIRNPLNSIHMNVQLLRESLNREPHDMEALDRTAATVQREIKRLDRVVRDFVQYSRPPALDLQPGSINHVIRAALDVLDAQIRDKNLHVETLLASARPVRMDRDRMQRAIYNVLLNAVQVLPENGKITCRSHDEGDLCQLEFSDDGPGIAPEKSAHIFELFYTTKQGGTGLGLPLANRIVEEHGGRMAVASEPGHGATFAVFLPFEGPSPRRGAGPVTVPVGGGS